MKKITTFVLEITVFLLVTFPLFAQNYYVDGINGNDVNSGRSKQTAWKTIDKLNCALDKCGIISPYDNIWLKRGSIFLESNLDISSSHNLKFGAYGIGDMPIISRDTPTNINVIVDDSREGVALEIAGSQKIIISNIEFQGGWASVLLTDSSRIKLLKLHIGKNSQYGIVISDSGSNHNITIDRCYIESSFSFPYTYADSKEKRTGDGLVVYAMSDSKIINNFFKNWGHASINLDAYTYNQEISGNVISGNYLTSPNIAYGGRISLDDAHGNTIKMNDIVNTSVASQLGGYNNKYINNLFLNTHTPPNGVKDNDGSERVANNTAVLIEAYSNKSIYNNIYKGNRIINSEGVGLKISDAGGLDIKDNEFKNNIISGCGYGEKGNNISLEVEPNSEGASYSNIFKNNKILNTIKDTIFYRGGVMDVENFNRQSSHDDQINNNIGTKL